MRVTRSRVRRFGNGHEREPTHDRSALSMIIGSTRPPADRMRVLISRRARTRGSPTHGSDRLRVLLHHRLQRTTVHRRRLTTAGAAPVPRIFLTYPTHAACDDLKAGRVDAILTWHMDRRHRRPRRASSAARGTSLRARAGERLSSIFAQMVSAWPGPPLVLVHGSISEHTR